MTAGELADEVERVILVKMEAYTGAVESLQGVIYARLERILKDLDLDSEGYIKQSAVNRSILLQAENALDELLPGESFISAVGRTLDVIPVIDSLNSEYFSSFEGFKSNRNYIKALQNSTIDSIENNILGDGLKAQIKNPLVDIMSQNVNSGGQYSGFLKQVREFITGSDQFEGRLMSYSRNYLSDTLFQFSRAYQESVTADLKLDWYLYSGGLMDKSREFCIERSGNFYHRKEIESWASLEWQGKARGTTKASIFWLVGGYVCRHSLIPVAENIVPKSDLARVK